MWDSTNLLAGRVGKGVELRRVDVVDSAAVQAGVNQSGTANASGFARRDLAQLVNGAAALALGVGLEGQADLGAVISQTQTQLREAEDGVAGDAGLDGIEGGRDGGGLAIDGGGDRGARHSAGGEGVELRDKP